MKRTILPIIILIVFCASYANAGGFGLGIHSGYGVLKYEEKTSTFQNDIESESTQNMILFGVSGEYSLSIPKNFYVGVTTDWAFGLRGRETWKEDKIKVQTDDLSVFGQFYDLRFGYKNSLYGLYYRFYLSGGWDGLHFQRDEFVWHGRPLEGNITEDFSLWRFGMGTGFGYKFGRWALDGRFAYSYYFDGKIKNSALPQLRFDTNGTCLDMGIGVAYGFTERMNFYLGASYTLVKLDESDIIQSGTLQAVFPESRAEIIAGVVNLTYSF